MSQIRGQVHSFNALIGLTAKKNAKTLPLSTWGAGTRRLAALEIAGANQGAHPIMLVDEVERGLEPYRQRTLLADLDKSGSQVFVTTHSPTVLRAARNAKLWYVDFKGSIGRLADTVRRHQQADPETFLSRLAIVAEGKTEKGFLIHLLKRAIGDLLDHGIWITDGGGNDPTLQLLQDLSKSGLAFAGFADDEGTSRDKWKALEKALGPLLFRWSGGSLEQTGLVPEFETRD